MTSSNEKQHAQIDVTFTSDNGFGNDAAQEHEDSIGQDISDMTDKGVRVAYECDDYSTQNLLLGLEMQRNLCKS